MKNKKTQMQTMKKVLDYIKKYSVYVVLSLLFAVATVAFTLYIPILTGDAVDLILGEGIVDFEGIYYNRYAVDGSGPVGNEYLQQQDNLWCHSGYPGQSL